MHKRRKRRTQDEEDRSGRNNPRARTSGQDLLYDELTELPTVPLLLGRIRRMLKESRQLGLLSISVLQGERVERRLGWQGYESLVRDVASFVVEIKRVALRRDDYVSEVMISGNAFVILLSPPRGDHPITYADLDKVRRRVETKLARFVRERLAPELVERFGIFVGCTVLTGAPAVRLEKIVYSALEEAFTDSLQQRQRVQRLDAYKLNDLLKSGAIHSVYQPVVDLQERRPIGFEALTRISNGAFEGPDRLLRVANENNTVWEIERLCRSRAIRGSRGLASDQMLFLNMEPDSIHDPELRGESTFSLLRDAGLQPTQIVLEMTEHSVVRDMGEFRQVLDYFKFLGFRLAMDDVGSGYSGLKSIAELKPDFIKIDMALIRDIDRHPIKQDLTGTIARFSKSSGITLVAEGVETVAELRCLRAIGVRYAQGYLFARPGPPFPRVPPESLD